MIRLILIVVLALFVIAGGLAVALYHFFGWKGLIVFPFFLIAAAWLAKIVISNLVKKFALGLFGMKAGALKGASLNVHSMKSIPKPPAPVPEPDDRESDQPGADQLDDGDDETEGASEPDEPEPPKDYVEVDLTITPNPDACNSIWEPSELILTSEMIKSLSDLENKEVGTTHSVEIWDGAAFGPDDPGKYPGAQRLKIIFAVKPGARDAWLHYYHEPIGQLRLPPGTIDV